MHVRLWQEKDRQMFLNTAGNSAMAKAGSGDVLAGVITGLLAQHMKVYEGTVRGSVSSCLWRRCSQREERRLQRSGRRSDRGDRSLYQKDRKGR